MRRERRIELCAKCGSYTKVISVDEATPFPLLAIEDLATMDLDGAAMERGYRRPELYDFDSIEPLKPLREYVTVVSGLRNKGGESSSPHGIIEETWLNCVSPRQRNAKTGAGVTVDQIAARHLGKDTPLPSLELCLLPRH